MIKNVDFIRVLFAHWFTNEANDKKKLNDEVDTKTVDEIDFLNDFVNFENDEIDVEKKKSKLEIEIIVISYENEFEKLSIENQFKIQSSIDK